MGKVRVEEVASIVRAVLWLGRRLRAERPEGSASVSAIAILSTLSRLGPMPATRLASEERLRLQSLTRLLARLQDEGWIARTLNVADRRETSIALTDAGRTVLAADIAGRRRWLERAMAATLSESERELLLQAADAMIKVSHYRGRPER